MQIKCPLDAKVDCVEEFNQQVEEILIRADNVDNDTQKEVDDTRRSFYMTVISMIDEHYHLECDTDGIAEKRIDEMADICDALYQFFTIKKKKMLKNMVLTYILRNADSIVDVFDHFEHKKDITSTLTKSKLGEGPLACIVANIHEVIAYIKSLDIDMADMIDCADQDLFYVYQVNELMNEGTIRTDFQARYFNELWSCQDCNYDDIVARIEKGIYKSANKKKGDK